VDGKEKAEMLEEEQWEACLAMDGKAASGFEKYRIWDAFLGFYPMMIITGLGEHAAGSFRRAGSPWQAPVYGNPEHDRAAVAFRNSSYEQWKDEERERDRRRALEEEARSRWNMMDGLFLLNA
jgi:hypothetical protein